MDLLPDLWKQEYWLPPGVTWKDMEQLADSDRPQPKDLLVALPLSLCFVALRHVFERYASGIFPGGALYKLIKLSLMSRYYRISLEWSPDCHWFTDRLFHMICINHPTLFIHRFLAPPLCRWLGVKKRSQIAAAPSPQLESFYTQRSRHPTQKEVASLMLLCGKTQRQIEMWFRRRRNQDRPCQTKKFGEAAWRFFFYLTAFVAGLVSLFDRPWFWDHRECWRQYPFQDFKEQVIHHLATIILLSFSYCANYIRIGTLILLLHDSSDILLESAKMFHYGTGWKKTCDSLFVVFSVVFLVTRLVIFPSKLIRATLLLSMEVFEPFVGYYFFNILLMVLQVLHIFWAGLILRMVFKFLKGKLEKDERSDEESVVEEEENSEDENLDQRRDCYWEKSKETLNSRFSALTNNCVLNNLTHQRLSLPNRMAKSQ
uniref:Ceramide synthase 2-like n=1 Tax=Oryzias melastigma TaxID=30732 RepID=A0A3B3DSF7_ORYME